MPLILKNVTPLLPRVNGIKFEVRWLSDIQLYQNIELAVQFLQYKKEKNKQKKESTSTSLPYLQVSPNSPKYATEEANWMYAIWQHPSLQSS